MSGLSRTLRIAGLAALVGAALALFHRSSEPSILGRYSAGYATLVACAALAGAFLLVLSRPSLAEHVHAARVQISLLAVSSLVTLVSMEACVRLVDPIGISYYELGYQYTSDKLADERLAYRHRPQHRGIYAGWLLETNSLGFRDDEITAEPPPGEVRILLLGDSVTLGMGVPREVIFADLLERDLSRRIGAPTQVINTGVGSYNTQQELMVLENVGLALSPDAIVLVFVNNDIDPIPYGFDPDDIMGVAGRNWIGRLEILAGRSWLYRLAAHVGRVIIRPRFTAPPAWWSTGVVPGWDRVDAALASIQVHSLERNVPFVVAHWRNTRSPEDELLQAHLERSGRAHGFAIIDAIEWFEPHPRSSYLRSPVDSHPNALGHRLTADGIAQGLEDLGVIDRLRSKQRARRSIDDTEP